MHSPIKEINGHVFNKESLHVSTLQVFHLGGIPGLVSLMRSPAPGVSQAAAGALRNLVFKDQKNKLEVQNCGGIAKALQLLKETDSTETQKQITGMVIFLMDQAPQNIGYKVLLSLLKLCSIRVEKYIFYLESLSAPLLAIHFFKNTRVFSRTNSTSNSKNMIHR